MSGAQSKRPIWPHGFAPIAPDSSIEPFGAAGQTWWRMKPRKPVTQAPHDSTRMLLIEPDAYHRRVLRILLTTPHASLIEMSSGAAAIDLLGFKSFDLIITAIGADRAGDMHVVKWIRRNPSAWSDIPILGLLEEDDTDGAGRLVARIATRVGVRGGRSMRRTWGLLVLILALAGCAVQPGERAGGTAATGGSLLGGGRAQPAVRGGLPATSAITPSTIAPAGRGVALLVSLSGPNAERGQTLARAAKLALRDAGSPALDVRDTMGTAEGAAAAAEAAIAAGAGLILTEGTMIEETGSEWSNAR